MGWLLLLLAIHFSALLYALWATQMIRRQDNKIAELRQQLNEAKEQLYLATPRRHV
jgi:hypothetical protein